MQEPLEAGEELSTPHGVELQAVASLCVGAGNRSWVLREDSRVSTLSSNCRAFSWAPCFGLLNVCACACAYTCTHEPYTCIFIYSFRKI